MSNLATKINLSLREAVAYLQGLGVTTSYRSLKRWIRLGLIRTGKVQSRTRFVTRESCDRFAAGEPEDRE